MTMGDIGFESDAREGIVPLVTRGDTQDTVACVLQDGGCTGTQGRLLGEGLPGVGHGRSHILHPPWCRGAAHMGEP